MAPPPALRGVRSRHSSTFFVPLVAPETTIVLRITGDLLESAVRRRWHGVANGIAIVLVFGNTVRVLRRRDEGP